MKDASGVCKPIVKSCEKSGPAVCGCDGRTYPDACEAERVGAFVRHFRALRVTAPRLDKGLADVVDVLVGAGVAEGQGQSMSIESVKAYLAARAPDVTVIELPVSTATVAEAAAGHGVPPAAIAKTLSLRVGERRFLLGRAGSPGSTTRRPRRPSAAR